MLKAIGAIGRKFTDYFNSSRDDSIQSFNKMVKDSGVNSKNIDFEIRSLLFFSFDFGIASGPEVEVRNQIRDCFLESLNMSRNDMRLLNDRVMEYTNAYQDDYSGKLLTIGNVFAKHTGNEADSIVVTWAILIFETNYKFASESTAMLLSHIDEMK